MNRRESLKTLGIGTLSASVLIAACNSDTKNANVAKEVAVDKTGRQDFEIIRDKSLQTEKFFDPVEMATITALADLIIPKDEHSGSASDAGVPAFIEFIVKDEPEHQLPMRGGLHWLNLQCMSRYNNGFKDCSLQQQTELLNEIAYPAKSTPLGRCQSRRSARRRNGYSAPGSCAPVGSAPHPSPAPASRPDWNAR